MPGRLRPELGALAEEAGGVAEADSAEVDQDAGGVRPGGRVVQSFAQLVDGGHVDLAGDVQVYGAAEVVADGDGHGGRVRGGGPVH